MSICNHVWRDTPLPTPKKTHDELMSSIINASTKGWWLKGEELTLAKDLFIANEITYCDKCEGRKAVYARMK